MIPRPYRTLGVRAEEGVATLTLDRPDRLNAFNEELYDATTEALIEAAADPGIAVVVITGTGRSFSAGTDVVEMAARNTGGAVDGKHGFGGMIDQLVEFPKPLLCAVNGIALDDKLGSAYINLGTALAETGRLDEARRALSRALALDPSDPRARANMDDLAQLEKRRTVADAGASR